MLSVRYVFAVFLTMMRGLTYARDRSVTAYLMTDEAISEYLVDQFAAIIWIQGMLATFFCMKSTLVKRYTATGYHESSQSAGLRR